MTHHDDEVDDAQVAAAFQSLDHQIRAGVDTDESLRRMPTSNSRSPRRRVGLAAAAVLLVIGVGASLLWSVRGDDRVTAIDDSTSTTEAPAPCEMFVYLNPTASAEQIDAVGADVAGSELIESWTYLDQAATYEEFRRLFAEQTDFVDAVSPGQLPTSFRVVAADSALGEIAAAFESLPGVYRAEVPESGGCERDGSSGSAPAESEYTTTTEPGVPWTHRPPELSGTVTFARAGTGTGCESDAEPVPTQPSGCPPPGDAVRGTLMVDGTMVVIPASASLRGCGPGDGMEPISFEELMRRIDEVDPVNALASVWNRSGYETPPELLVAEAVSFGSCG